MKALSVVIITKNEAHNLGRCIASVATIADEIIVADSQSSDNTTTIAKKMGATVHSIVWKGYVETKNEANALAKNDWILSLDADEALTPALCIEIEKLAYNPSDIYFLNRKTYLGAKWIQHCGWFPDVKPRIFNRRFTAWEGHLVHERLHIPQQAIQVKLAQCFNHYSFSSAQDMEARMLKYAKLEAEQLKKSLPIFGRLWMYTAPVIKFIKVYFIKKGYKDGTEGLQIARTMALARYYKYYWAYNN